MTETLRYCSDCGRLHRTETITHDTDGWPDTFRWLEPHDPGSAALTEVLEKLGEVAGQGVTLAISKGDWDQEALLCSQCSGRAVVVRGE